MSRNFVCILRPPFQGAERAFVGQVVRATRLQRGRVCENLLDGGARVAPVWGQTLQCQGTNHFRLIFIGFD